MRLALFLILFAVPAHAWEFTPGLPCRLTHEAPGLSVVLTHDPTAPIYTITLRRATPWPDGPSFSIRFEGPRGLTISTARHVLSDGGRALTVTDTGFVNVLDGLQFNAKATGFSGDADITMSLDGAAEPVAQFRACRGIPST